MSGIAIGGLIFGGLMLLLVLRVPIGIAMFTAGASGYFYLTDGQALRMQRHQIKASQGQQGKTRHHQYLCEPQGPAQNHAGFTGGTDGQSAL